MKVLVVNADDLGISAGVNRGIVASHACGLVTSASLIANLPAFDDAVRRIGVCPRLGVGVHLNLTCGRPLLDSGKSSLTDRDGNFHPPRRLLARLSIGAVRRAEVEDELAAQLRRVLEAGIRVTHLDTHHNVHLHPLVARCVCALAQRAEIGWVRFERQAPLMPALLIEAGLVSAGDRARRTLAACALRLPRRGGHSPQAVSRAIFGAPQMRSVALRDAFAALACSIGEGVTELVCHPGYADQDLRRADSYSEARETEMAALTDPVLRELLDQNRIELANYRSLV